MATVQIRNLDDQAYGVLRTRAAASGRSLQEYLRLLLEESANREDSDTYWARYRADVAWPDTPISVTDIVESVREGRRS